MTDLATNSQGGDESVSTPAEVASFPQEGDASQELSLEAEADDGDASEDDTAEIEHDGQTYRVPKALKGAFLMHADYTRKTQEVAEHRRALAEQDASLRQQAQIRNEHVNEIGRVVAYNEALVPYEQLDWRGLHASNPENAQGLWVQYMQLKNQRDQAAGHLHAKVTNWHQANEAHTAARVAESRAVLSRDIKDWSPELYGKLKDFGVREFGFSPQEVAGVIDPRLIKVMHRALIGEQMMRKAAATARAAEAEGVRPLPQVGNSASATRWSPTDKASDRSSTAEWMRRRNEQLRKAK